MEKIVIFGKKQWRKGLIFHPHEHLCPPRWTKRHICDKLKAIVYIRRQMVEKTKKTLRNMVIYQIYVRNYSEEGTLRAVIDDLDRIKDLGVDIVYLLPIHPIGLKNRKGTLGSPYSISDYRLINPELGSTEDLLKLIFEVHKRDMKIMMDIVFNHTSCDSRLLSEHPEWFYRDQDGDFANKVGNWSDVYDFDYAADKKLWEELTETLTIYADMGIDGFRADVASLVPLDFWKYARRQVSKDYRQVIWLSESVHGAFCKYVRDLGFSCSSESEIYQVFDMAYDYDVRPYMEDYFAKRRPLKDYLEALARQDEIYPDNYVKMKNLDNHDVKRIAFYCKNDPDKIINWTGFLFFQKGAVMLYNGQEFSSDKTPSLFEKDIVTRKKDITPFIQKMIKLKKRPVFATGAYNVFIPDVDGVACTSFENGKEKLVGIFNLAQADGMVKVPVENGRYRNQLDGSTFSIRDGKLRLQKSPIIIQIRK